MVVVEMFVYFFVCFEEWNVFLVDWDMSVGVWIVFSMGGVMFY